jgi:hypothetical protein
MSNKTDQLDLTFKQRKWIKAYIETGNATEAAIKSYDCKGNRVTAANIGSENLAKLQIPDLMEEMGLTDVALVNVGTEGMMKANKSLMDGSIVPDYNTRHRYWETMLKLKRKLDQPTVLQQFNTGGEMTLNFMDRPDGR